MNVQLKWMALAAIGLSPLSVLAPTQASTLFSRAEVDQSRFVAVASPFAGGTAHQLLIIEQISNARPCWSESGVGPVTISPLLGNFDFTGICGRSIDSNGYSIRMADEDLGWKYSLRIVRRNGDLMLVGVPVVDRRSPELVIGRANGLSNGFAKLNLTPGWRLTKRSYGGQTVGHVYLTNDRPLSSAIATGSPAPAVPRPQPVIVTPVVPPVPPVSTRPTPSLTKPPAGGIPIRVPLPESVAPRRTSVTPVPPPSSVRPVPPAANPVPVRNAGDYVVPTIEVSP